jgi:hypothetical protein
LESEPVIMLEIIMTTPFELVVFEIEDILFVAFPAKSKMIIHHP